MKTRHSFSLLMLPLLGILFVGMSFCDSAAAQETLRWNLKQGDKFTLQMDQFTSSLVTLSKGGAESSVQLLVNIDWDVISAADETFVIEQTIKSIRIEMKGTEQDPVLYDSREKKVLVGAAKELATAVAGLLDAKFKLTMNSLGKVTAAERLTPVKREAAPVTEAGKAAVQSKENLEKIIAQSFVPLPEAAIAGEELTWHDERSTRAALGEVTFKRTYSLPTKPLEVAGKKLDNLEGIPAHRILMTGKLEITKPATVKGAPKLKEQSHQGDIYFAKENGRLMQAQTTQRLVTESTYRDSTITVDLATNLTTKLTPR